MMNPQYVLNGMSLKIPHVKRKQYPSTQDNFNIDLKDSECPGGSHPIRCYSRRGCKGHGKRPYGIINLKVDQSQFLAPNNPTEKESEKLAKEKLFENLNDLIKTNKGCIVLYALEYFEKSSNVDMFVRILLSAGLDNEYLMDVITKNFMLLSNIVLYGEKIKYYMFNLLKHVHEDILSFGLGSRNQHNPQLCLKYYDHDIVVRYYAFVSLLFFRFRKHLDCYGRYKSLSAPVLAALSYLLKEQSLASLIFLTELVQLNFHSLTYWYQDEIEEIVKNIKAAWAQCKDVYVVKFYWLSATLDIIYQGPILPKPLYNRYAKLVGPDWPHAVVYPPVQVLEQVSKVIATEKMACFHIEPYDIFRNMFVNLP
jgi:hypothetical protein